MDQTRQLAGLGFMRDGHIELTFLTDTIQPQRLYIQRLVRRVALETQTRKNPQNEIPIPRE